jgi:hypothetical protein
MVPARKPFGVTLDAAMLMAKAVPLMRRCAHGC